MRQFEEEARAFGRTRHEEEEQARQRVALRLLCGVDITDVFGIPPERKARLVRQIERLIERERLKGMRRHWSYDLNRHIALKQVLDRLRENTTRTGLPCEDRSPLRERRRPAERRRRHVAP